MQPKVAAVQLNSSDNVSDNLEVCAYYIEQAKHAECSLVLLPENFAWMGDEQHAQLAAEPFIKGQFKIFYASKQSSTSDGLLLVATRYNNPTIH
ncbi:MAG: putative amidohydrolase [Saprospiraceae bacterium]|jgi:predicted amidohydrolase